MSQALKAESLFDLSFVSDGTLSHDGARVAVVHTRIALAENPDDPPAYRSQIHLYDTRSGDAQRLTHGRVSHVSPRFSPDGTYLAFMSRCQDDDKPQLFIMPLKGGDAHAVTKDKTGVSEFAWHPDGQRIAYVSRGDWEDTAAQGKQARVIERMFYKRDGSGFRPAEPAQVYLLDIPTGERTRLTSLQSDPGGLVFSADGQHLYFTAARDTQEDDVWLSNIWRLSLQDGEARPLLDAPFMASQPSPSPDGTLIAFFAPLEPFNFATPTSLWVVTTEGGDAKRLTDGIEVLPSVAGDSRHGAYPNRAAWSDDGQSITVNANARGRSGLARFDMGSGELTVLQQEDRVVSGFHCVGDRCVFTAETPQQPGELFLLEHGQERRLSHENERFVQQYTLARTREERHVTAADGTVVPYWVLTPENPREDQALVVQVHGGPHTNYGYGFMFEFQFLAARGYTVVYGNPRGSSSYGPRFVTSMLGAYGTIDADDVLAITRAAKAAHPRPDAPVHLTGGSYGGFMTNWLVGHTDEFRSAVTQRSICNWLSFYGTSDIGYRFSEQEVAGNPWKDTEKLWAQSPLKYVHNVTTPTLIIHAEADHRCPVEQAEQFFIALKRIGKAPTRLVRFPDEGHELSRSGRPDRRVARLELIAGWFEEHA
jgi:dipeptidyl aminopeptidase/acylaminoacyl peptidase